MPIDAARRASASCCGSQLPLFNCLPGGRDAGPCGCRLGRAAGGGTSRNHPKSFRENPRANVLRSLAAAPKQHDSIVLMIEATRPHGSRASADASKGRVYALMLRQDVAVSRTCTAPRHGAHASQEKMAGHHPVRWCRLTAPPATERRASMEVHSPSPCLVR